MKGWKPQGDRLILLLDPNEDTNNGNLAVSIIPEPKLKTKNLVKEKARKDGSATRFSGTEQIDGAFSTLYVDCYGERFLPFWSDMGDHKAVVVDIPHQSVLE